jgi:hypothetical protein
VAIAASVVLLAACNKDDAPERPKIPASFNIRGDVRLSGSQNVTGDLSNCAGVGAYVDVYKGGNVVVTDQDGKPLANGTITDGIGTNYFEEILDECSFRIRVANVPRAAGYFVVVARQPAQPITLGEVIAGDGYVRFDANPPTVRAFGEQ